MFAEVRKKFKKEWCREINAAKVLASLLNINIYNQKCIKNRDYNHR